MRCSIKSRSERNSHFLLIDYIIFVISKKKSIKYTIDKKR